jgi:hypothetical protein
VLACARVCVHACACVRTRGYASLVTQASKSGGRPLRPLADLSSNDERPSAGYGIHRDPGGPMVQAASAQAPAQWCMRRGPRRVTHGACCMKPCRTNSVWCLPYCMGCILHAAWSMVCGAASLAWGGWPADRTVQPSRRAAHEPAGPVQQAEHSRRYRTHCGKLAAWCRQCIARIDARADAQHASR